MAKEFFKSYLASKTALEQSNTIGTLNFKCLEVFEKYLFSYKWCRNETERQIFENALVGIAPNKMIIQVERIRMIMVAHSHHYTPVQKLVRQWVAKDMV